MPPRELRELLGGFAPTLWCAVKLNSEPSRFKQAIVACARLVQNVRCHGVAFAPPPRRRGTGELLGGFDTAFEAGAWDEAQDLLDQLRAGDLLDGLNLRCLTVRLLVARGKSASVEFSALVEELHSVQLPRTVREIVDASKAADRSLIRPDLSYGE